jgi:transketolase
MAIIFDMNAQQCDGEVESVMPLGSIADKLRAFGAHVLQVDGHDIDALAEAGSVVPEKGPLAILASTNPCCGMPYLEKRRPRLHYVRFKTEDEKHALEAAIRQQLYQENAL